MSLLEVLLSVFILSLGLILVSEIIFMSSGAIFKQLSFFISAS